jgi:hypothetical protein
MPGLNLAFWRKWHRWIAWPATIFLLWACGHGVLVAFTEFFGQTKRCVSDARHDQSRHGVGIKRCGRANCPRVCHGAARSNGAARDKLEVQFKGTAADVTLFTANPPVARTASCVSTRERPALVRGDPTPTSRCSIGSTAAKRSATEDWWSRMFWGLALLVLSITGLIIYIKLWRPGQTGMRRSSGDHERMAITG